MKDQLSITDRPVYGSLAELERDAHSVDARGQVHFARLAMLGTLFASLVHELNQPLAAILANAEAALRVSTGDAANRSELGEILQDIIGDGLRVRDLISRLRPMFKRGDLQRQPLNINDVIRDACRLVRIDMASRNVSLRLGLGERLPQVSGDPVSLQQVVLNLLLNGAEAMSEVRAGGRVLSVDTLQSDAGGVEVRVCDTGVGIDSEHLERIFEPFYSTKPMGLGIGLALSWAIVLDHSGKLWAANNTDRGMTFHLTLPPSPRMNR
jgi:two-component system, LuxR family, sensor kinase FixL